MKTLIATSVIALAGLYASFSHAAEVKTYHCAATTCTAVQSPLEHCGKPQRTSIITDLGTSFEVVDIELGYNEPSPDLDQYLASQGVRSAETISRGDHLIYMRKESSPKGYSIVNASRRTGYVAAKCKLISVEHEKARN